MSSDPKKPGLDVPPSGTPELLQQDVSLDRRCRVPAFEELQQSRTAAVPLGTVPGRPRNIGDLPTETVPKVVPPGLQPRQPAIPIPPPPAPRAAPPSPVDFAQARPQVMPQVTPSMPTFGAVVPEGQSMPASRTRVGLKPAAARPTPDLQDESEPRTEPAGKAVPRTFTPARMPSPSRLPPEMLVTQPSAPGPFAQPQVQPAPQPPQSAEQPAFTAPSFEEAPIPTKGNTVTAEPAALWRRLGAWVADLILVGTLVLTFLTVAMAVIAPKNLTPLQQLMAIAVPGVALGGLLSFVYTTLFAFLWNGRTPGRRLMNIYLVDCTGQAPAPTRALIRALLSLVSFGLFLSGFWLALFDRHGQTLHDKLTRTFVVKLQDA